jgi:hypothetical protein
MRLEIALARAIAALDLRRMGESNEANESYGTGAKIRDAEAADILANLLAIVDKPY